MTINIENLVKKKLASELINPTGEYSCHEKVYRTTDKTISMKTMLKMFEATKCQELVPTLYPNFGVVHGYKQGEYKEPVFLRNLVGVVFEPLENDEEESRGSLFELRVTKDLKWEELNDECDVLNNANISFNQALFVCLVFNTVLAPDDYEIIKSGHPVDKAMLRTKQGVMLTGFFAGEKNKPTGEFLGWAAEQKINIIQLIKDANEKLSHQEKLNRDIEIFKEWEVKLKLVGKKYKSKVDVYRSIIIKLQLDISEGMVGRIIAKKSK